MGETERLTVKAITELQEIIETQRELICNLNAMNDKLQAKLDKIKQIVSNYDGTTQSMIKQFSEIQKVLEEK
jgi:chromosome condensin MukBEF complex kleisin-like MukF subunit